MKQKQLLQLGTVTFFLVIFVLSSNVVIGQNNMPERNQIYRFIRSTSDERAGDIRWIEIWESNDETRDAHQIVMVEGRGGQQGVEVSCYYALAIGSEMPIYMVDGKLEPVDTAERLWDVFENARLVAQSELFATNEDCESGRTDTINGIQAQQCTFQDRDASTVFLIRPPATSYGELWTAIDGDFPVRYVFDADGNDGDVHHRFEAIIPPADYVIEPPSDVNLACFDEGFPVPEGSRPLNAGNLTQAAFESDLSIDELERFYDSELLPTWTSEGSEQGARVYSRVLDSGNECQLYLRLTRRPDARGTHLAANVYPSFVDAANLPSPEGFASPIVVQSLTDATVSIDGDIRTVLADYTTELEAEGWVVRDILTDIRDESAFATFARDDYEMHITIDGQNGKAVLRLQTRSAVCGPIFSITP